MSTYLNGTKMMTATTGFSGGATNSLYTFYGDNITIEVDDGGFSLFPGNTYVNCTGSDVVYPVVLDTCTLNITYPNNYPARVTSYAVEYS
jgi:hypothetical protein